MKMYTQEAMDAVVAAERELGDARVIAARADERERVVAIFVEEFQRLHEAAVRARSGGRGV